MTFNINQMTIHNDNVKANLKTYLDRVASYPNHDADMLIRVFVDNYIDFCAFEAVDYMLGFTSQKHKLSDIINSKYVPSIVKFSTFKALVSAL